MTTLLKGFNERLLTWGPNNQRFELQLELTALPPWSNESRFFMAGEHLFEEKSVEIDE